MQTLIIQKNCNPMLNQTDVLFNNNIFTYYLTITKCCQTYFFSLSVAWMCILMAISTKTFSLFYWGHLPPCWRHGNGKMAAASGPKMSDKSEKSRWPMPKSHFLSWCNGFVWTCIVLLLHLLLRVGLMAIIINFRVFSKNIYFSIQSNSHWCFK